LYFIHNIMYNFKQDQLIVVLSYSTKLIVEVCRQQIVKIDWIELIMWLMCFLINYVLYVKFILYVSYIILKLNISLVLKLNYEINGLLISQISGSFRHHSSWTLMFMLNIFKLHAIFYILLWIILKDWRKIFIAH
jgi:hypothetical protein